MKKISILLLMVFAACMSFAQQTQNYIPKFGTGGSILNSTIFQDAGTPVFTGINTSSPTTQLHVHNPTNYYCGPVFPPHSNLTDDSETDTTENTASRGCGSSMVPSTICSESSILLTNNISGATINDGLLIQSSRFNGSIKLQHQGILSLSTCNSLRQSFSNGNITIYPSSSQDALFTFFETGLRFGNSQVSAFIRSSNTYSTATTPDYTWSGNNNTGIFHPNLNIIGFSTAGVERMRIDASGYVAIGTTNPAEKFHVVGNSVFSETTSSITSSAYIRGRNTYSSATHPDYTWSGNTNTGMFHPNANIIGFSIAGVERMRIDASGNITIGATDPKGYKLAVAGNVVAEKYVCKLKSGWPDFVFDENYKLPTLFELEQFIKINKHLPNVPNASEVKEDGIDLGEMNRILLQKLEEVTLYVIDLQKQIDELKKGKGGCDE